MKIPIVLFLAGIILITIFVYRDCVNNSFVFDDHSFIENNPHIRSLKNIPAFFLAPIHSTAGEGWKGIYRPLRTLSYALEYKIYRLNPRGYHLTNLILHIINIYLAFVFLSFIVPDKRVVILTTALFALHPVHTEPVCWIGSRADLLLGIFEFLTLISFTAFLQTGYKRYFYLMMGNFIIALLSKETAIVTPLIFLALSVFIGKRIDKKIITISFSIAVIYLAIRTYLLQGFAQREWWGGSFITNFLTGIKLVPHYIYLLIFPYHLSLDYGFQPARTIFDPKVIISVLILSFLMWWSYRCKKSNQNIYWLGMVWLFLFLAPGLNFIPITTITGDRFLYPGSLGAFLTITALIFNIQNKKWKILTLGIIIILISTYLPTIIKRTQEWKNDYTLFTSILKYNPSSWMSYQNLGTWYYHKKNYPNARKYFWRAEKIRKSSPLTYKGLGLVALETGKVEEAQKYFLKALMLNPRDADIGNLLAITFDIQRRYDIAQTLYKRYLQIAPHNQNIKKNLYALEKKLKKIKRNSLQTGQQLQ